MEHHLEFWHRFRYSEAATRRREHAAAASEGWNLTRIIDLEILANSSNFPELVLGIRKSCNRHSRRASNLSKH